MLPDNAFRLALQLHITGRCNLRCRHCYIEDRGEDQLSLAEIKALIDDFSDLVLTYNRMKRLHYPGQINLTGGEPFIREDLFDILEYIASREGALRFALLTNGSLITPGNAARLKKLKPLFVQVSIDGSRKTHDFLRAPGNFDRTLKACDTLRRAGIRTLVSFTAHRMNAADYPAVLRACRLHRVDKLWTDRLVPIGTGSEMADGAMGAGDYRDYVRMIRRHQSGPMARIFPTEVALTRSLQFMDEAGACCSSPYQCSAGDSLIVVDERGDVFPCRRLPIRAGSIKDTPLSRIYFDSEVMKQLRRKVIPEACSGCAHREMCRGGSRCVSYALTGKLDGRDPACWLNGNEIGRNRREK